MMGGGPGRSRGFTLVEVCVAVAIMAITTAVMVPAINNMTRAELRRGARQLAATVRRCFDEAALSGQTHRLVFTLTEAPDRAQGPNARATEPIVIEASELSLNFTGHDGALEEAKNPNLPSGGGYAPFGQDFGGAPAGDATDAKPQEPDAGAQDAASAAGEMFRNMFNINKVAKAQGEPSFDAVAAVHLPAGVQVHDVWIDGMHEASAEGSIALVFFATGYTQRARLHLKDASDNYFTLEVQPLTGQVAVREGFLQAAHEARP